MLSFLPRQVLDEIWDVIESDSEGFPTYSFAFHQNHKHFDISSDSNLFRQLVSVELVLINFNGIFP